MGLTYADIELTNSGDLVLVRSGHLAKENIRQMRVNALVDSGAWLLTINDDIRNQLGLPVIDKDLAELADGTIVDVDIVGPVDVRFQNRRVTADAMVLPDAVGCLNRYRRTAPGSWRAPPHHWRPETAMSWPASGP